MHLLQTLRNPLLVALLLLFVAPLPARAGMQVQRVVSPGGIEAWLVEDHANPLVSVALGFQGAGSAADPAGKEGLAEMVSGLLDEGAGDLDSQAFQARLADLSVDLSFDTGPDDFAGLMRTLTANRDAAFDLLRLAVTAPRFDAEPVERIRSQMLALVADRAEDPESIADRVWRRTAFPSHPYGRESLGTPESLKAVGVDDLKGFARGRFGRDVLRIGVVGDITAAELAPLLDRTFGPLPAKGEPIPVAEAVAGGAGQVLVVDRDMPQSIVVFGHNGIKRHDPDFYAAYVVNHILGGGNFSSRLTNEVREKRGLAYSIGSYLNTLEHAGLVQGQVATQNARVGESIDLIRQEWKRMAEEGPTAQELADAKTYLIGSYPLRFTSSGSTARALVAIQLEGLPIDYMEKRSGYIEAVTLADAKRVARRLLDPQALTVVVVGEPKGVTPTVEAPKQGG